jgi:nitrogen regulatory protein P-II 1
VVAVQLITAVVRPLMVDEIADALRLFGVRELIVTMASSLSDLGGHSEVYRGVGSWSGLRDEARIEVLAADEDAQDVVSVICGIASTGPGQGCRVWMIQVREFVQVPDRHGTQVS